MKQVVYLAPCCAQISYIKIIILICFYFLTLIQVSVILLRENLLATITTSTIGFVWSQRVVEDYIKVELLIKPIEKIKSEYEAINFFRYFNQIVDNYKENFESTILAGLVYDHQSKCKNSQCFCMGKYSLPLHKNTDFLNNFSLYYI